MHYLTVLSVSFFIVLLNNANGVGSLGLGRPKNLPSLRTLIGGNTRGSVKLSMLPKKYARRIGNKRKNYIVTQQGERFDAAHSRKQMNSLRAFFARKKLRRANARNCWLHALKSSGLKFQLSCTDDGKFSPKQCANNRCWCVDDVGKRIRSGGDDGYYSGMKDGLALECTKKSS